MGVEPCVQGGVVVVDGEKGRMGSLAEHQLVYYVTVRVV